MANTQIPDKSTLGFVYIKDRPAGHQKLVEAVTITSDVPTGLVGVTKDPNEAWITAPTPITHDTPFNITFVPEEAVKNSVCKFIDRTMTLTCAKPGYDDAVITVTVKTMPGGPPGGAGSQGGKVAPPAVGTGEGKGTL